MNILTKFLVETILGEEISNKIVVYSGRFQPFHKGHFATYQLLVKKFGKESVYIGTSDKTDNIKSPFGFKEKKYIINKMFGVSTNKIVQIKNPYAPLEILNKFDSKNTSFITAVGEKDEMRLGGKYFEPYKDNKDLEGYLDKGYVYVAPAQPNAISGTDVRNWLGRGNDEDRKKGFLKAYPKFDEKVFKLITLTLNKIRKEELAETTLGGYGADEGEPATMYIPDGTIRILDRGKPEPWFKQLGYTQMDKPKADTMRGKGKRKDKESAFRKVYYKVSNIVTSDLKPVEKPKGVDGWKVIKKENVNESLLMEGGAYGHMNHPFDIEMNLTFGDLKRIVKQALSGKLELAREKTDGQALAVSWVNGRLVAARNKSHLKNKGKDAMSVQDVISKFAGRGSVSDAFSFAIKDLESAIKGLSETSKKKIFKDGKCFMNCEIIYPENTNVIPYGQSLLVFHGTMEYNDEGTAIGENPEAGAQLAAMVKKVNADVQSKFKLQGPPIQKLPINKDLKAKQAFFLSKIQILQNEFGLTEKNGVADYHQAWWLNYVNKNTKGLDEQQKIGLVKRWAFGDKGFRIKDIKDDVNREWAEKIEKQDQQKITKDNLLKFETIFLGVGAEVLSFMTSVLTVNPDAAKQQMVGRLETAINSIKATGDAKNLDKLNIELARIEALGGFDKIVPNEGIVFNYKGNTFKLTGAFAPLNQILGIFTFSR